MIDPNIWNFYNRPPKAVAEAIDKFYIHNKHRVEVKVLAHHPFVEHMIGPEKEKLFGDLPSMSLPIFSFEILSGERVGQVLYMASGNFFRQFSLKE